MKPKAGLLIKTPWLQATRESLLFQVKPHFQFWGNDFIIHDDNKTLILLSKMRDLQGFQHKKRPCKIALARSIFYRGLQIGFTPNHSISTLRWLL